MSHSPHIKNRHAQAPHAKTKYIAAFVLLLILAGGLYIMQKPSHAPSEPTTTLTADLPDTLFYQGKPIDAECIADLAQGDRQSIDLAQCGSAQTEAENIVSVTPIALDKISEFSTLPYSFGNEYKCVDSDGYCGFFTYSYIGNIGDKAVILTGASGGGSGVFSSLLTYSKINDTLVLGKNIAGGDRCNSGIISASIDDNKIRYQAHATALQLFSTFAPDKEAVEQFNNLPDCAACCGAKITIEDDTPIIVELDADNFTIDETDDTVSACFDRHVGDYIVQHGIKLNAEQAGALMQKIVLECSATDTTP